MSDARVGISYVLIAINLIVWLIELGLGEKFINGLGDKAREFRFLRFGAAMPF